MGGPACTGVSSQLGNQSDDIGERYLVSVMPQILNFDTSLRNYMWFHVASHSRVWKFMPWLLYFFFGGGYSQRLVI